jgi:O-antigen ligase
VLAREVAWGYERLSGKAAQRSANNRVIANHAAFSMIKARPFFGWGFNNYDLYYPQFTTRVGDVPTTLGYGVTAHNTYLALAAELGLIGLFLYMFPAAWWLILSLKVWRRLPPRGFSSWRLLAMLWLLMLHMFIVCNFMNMYRPHLFGTTVWWMALGLIANIVYPYLKREDIATSYAPQSTSPPGYD